MSLERNPPVKPPRAHLMRWMAIGILAVVLLLLGVLRGVRRDMEGKRGRVQANARLLAALQATARQDSLRGALQGKSLSRLSGGRIVEGLTELAHWTEIRRVTFTTREVVRLESGAGMGASRTARLPVTVWLDAPAGAFASYLDGLGSLPWPVRVRSFEMKRAPQAADGMRIRLEIEVYGLAA
jgi:hypothetical protein